MRGVLIILALAGGRPWGCGRDGAATDDARWVTLRDEMVTTQIAARGVRDTNVLVALRAVPRHLFVPADLRAEAYADHPLPIGEGQTISQPYIVGLMTELLGVKPGDKVLEVGTGSGYQAAVLAAMGCEVYTIEIRPSLAQEAERRLAALGVKHVRIRAGDGYAGWPEAAPFAGVIVTAAPEHIPQPLLDQLKDGGHMVIPVGSFYQQLKVISRRGVNEFSTRDVIPVRFVPMTGEVERRP
ncbi:MAG: protein-L-isoaspartate(D-aspartate) O-methyltransferase [Thermoanaerobaculaceae bacterium]|jgi:protein-L-isoaspartate(D-aspartate) O-methyltransferase